MKLVSKLQLDARGVRKK